MSGRKEIVLKAAVEATEDKILVISGVAECITKLGIEHAI